MRIVARHSHLNGWEFIQVHKPHLWSEIEEVIAGVNARACKSKVSKEIRTKGKVFYAPKAMNKCMDEGFIKRGWKEKRTTYWVTEDAELIEKTLKLSEASYRRFLVTA